MTRCTKCGNENGQGQVVCQNCSSPIVQDEGKKCPFCETYCGPFAKVCSSCGHPLFGQQDKASTGQNMSAENNIIQFDVKKLKRKKAKQIKKQRPPKKIGTIILWCVMVVLFVLGVLSMFL
ncbi:MAG: hypothetical protein ABS949_06320 [Solibacillus sp.]